VLLVLVDDLNTQVGAWGAPVKTPAIDRLAARGVRFDRAYVPVAMCSPSRVSILTGWRPERTGVWTNVDPPRPEGAVPLQEHFAKHGAVTAAVGKILHFPENFRWDVREEHPDVGEEESEGRTIGTGGEGLWEKATGTDLDQPDGRRARRAALLLQRFRHRPFFLAVGLVRPHLRWIAPTRYFGLYPPEATAPLPFPPDDLADVPAIAVKTRPQPLPGLPLLGREPPGLVPDPALRRQATAAYRACVSFADAQVGVLLDALDRLDLWKDTVVVLAGDNGFHLGEHGGLLRKDTLFEEALRVPHVVAAPGLVPEGAVARGPAEVLDVYPTVVELAGLPPVAGLDGRSLAPVLATPPAPGRETAVSYRRVQPPERALSLRTETTRYTLWPDGSEELYDLRSRSGEAQNLAARPDRAAEKARLRTRLEALVAAPRQP
jgi:arylsulfatase A-like enzyme